MAAGVNNGPRSRNSGHGCSRLQPPGPGSHLYDGISPVRWDRAGGKRWENIKNFIKMQFVHAITQTFEMIIVVT